LLAQSDWRIQRRAHQPFQTRRLHDQRKTVKSPVTESPEKQRKPL
jgi:hypothetical protein